MILLSCYYCNAFQSIVLGITDWWTHSADTAGVMLRFTICPCLRFCLCLCRCRCLCLFVGQVLYHRDHWLVNWLSRQLDQVTIYYLQTPLSYCQWFANPTTVQVLRTSTLLLLHYYFTLLLLPFYPTLLTSSLSILSYCQFLFGILHKSREGTRMNY